MNKMYLEWYHKQIAHAKVKMYVMRNSRVNSNAGPVVLTLQSGAMLSKKVE